VLVGREAEVRELLGAARTALAGSRGCLALVAGDAGIGKTRLVGEVADQLRADGLTVAWAACRADGGAPPYWPWAQLLARLGRAEALARPDTADPELARFQVFEAVAGALRAAAPVLLVLDDLHWADPPSVKLLDALGGHLGTARVLVLGTYRDTEPAPELAEVAAERRIVLGGLAVDELGPALADATGERLPSEVVAVLHRRTGGNPFYAAESVRLLRAEGRLHEAGDPVLPSGVRAVLDRRLDRLPAGSEVLLRAAAAVDAGVTTGADAVLLAAVADVGPAEVADLLAPAERAQLVHTVGGRYRFPHALVADTLTARTPPAQRLDLHRRAAAALALRVGAGVGEPAEAARQLLAAARLSGDPAEARTAAAAGAAAATSAVRHTAYETAVRWLTDSLAVLPDVAGGDPDRGELLCRLGEAALSGGDPGRARRAFSDASELARRRDRPELLAAAALGRTGGAAGFEVDLGDPDRVALLEEALTALPAADSALRSRVSARLSVALAFTGREPRRRTLAADAVAMARRLADPRALAAALAASSDAMAGPAHVRQRRAMAEEIVGCAREVGDRVLELLGRRLRLLALAEAGHWAEVDNEIDGYARIALPLCRPGLTWYVPLWRGARASMQGDVAAAAGYDAQLAAQVERSGSVNAELLMLTQRFVLATLAGRTPEGGYRRFAEIAPDVADTSLCTPALMRAVDGTPGAGPILHRYLAGPAGRDPDSEWLPEMVQAAQTAVLLGDRAAAALIYPALVPHAELFAVEGILAGTWGCVAGHLGRLAWLLERPDDARRHLALAVERDATAGSALADRTRSWAAEVAGPAPASPPDPDGTPSFRLDGEVWTLSYAGRAVRLRDSKGLHDLAALLARPGHELAVHELVGRPTDAGADSFELVDRTAIEAYRRRLGRLEAELDEAAGHHDLGRAERAARERDALLAELTAVTGLDGRPRQAGSDLERMRKAVGNRIRQALGRIEGVHPELGRHLRVSVRTGTYCRYEPEREVRWTV
jgi:hypothetical protein